MNWRDKILKAYNKHKKDCKCFFCKLEEELL